MGKGIVELPIKYRLKPIQDVKKRVVEQPIKEAIKPGRAGKNITSGGVDMARPLLN